MYILYTLIHATNPLTTPEIPHVKPEAKIYPEPRMGISCLYEEIVVT